MINIKKAFCGGLVASQLLSVGCVGSCMAPCGNGNYVYVGNNGVACDGSFGFVPRNTENTAPKVIVVKEKKEKKEKKKGSGFGKKLLAAGVLAGAGFAGYKYYKTLSDDDKGGLLGKFEWLFDKLYKAAYIVASFRIF